MAFKKNVRSAGFKHALNRLSRVFAFASLVACAFIALIHVCQPTAQVVDINRMAITVPVPPPSFDNASRSKHTITCGFTPSAVTPTPPTCVSISKQTVAFVDTYSLPFKLTGSDIFRSKTNAKCDRVDVWILGASLFFSPGVIEAAAMLPSRPSSMVVDWSNEHGSTLQIECRMRQIVAAGAIDPSATQLHFVSQGGFDNGTRRQFNQFWLFPRDLPNLQAILKAKPAIHSARFLCLGGFPRPHKVQFLAELDAAGILQDPNVVWSGPSPATQKWGDYKDVLSKLHYTDEEIKRTTKFLPKLPHIIDVDVGVKKARMQDFDLALYNRGRIHVVLETDFYTSFDRFGCEVRVRYTEKTLKAILSGSPFLLFAAPGTLALLREHGFRTFAPYINESYDTLPAHRARVDALIYEIKRVLQMSVSEFDQLMANIKPVADHNREWLASKKFADSVSKQAMYAFGLSSKPAFDSTGYMRAMEELITSVKPECGPTFFHGD
jgi:hypothetical protein